MRRSALCFVVGTSAVTHKIILGFSLFWSFNIISYIYIYIVYINWAGQRMNLLNYYLQLESLNNEISNKVNPRAQPGSYCPASFFFFF